jgi:hypothetical protein
VEALTQLPQLNEEVFCFQRRRGKVFTTGRGFPAPRADAVRGVGAGWPDGRQAG